ncbi:hypothetical protein [Halomontanus rarus]|uniref:hypothetical protein n=1 Tax=Halomontanus rarus TaxID=3034020 RepID=UPI00293BDC86|nr:hypothetical protein [Halovivax sp. KZCA124]
MSDSNREDQRLGASQTIIHWVTLAVVLLFALLHVYRGLRAGSIIGDTSIQNFGIVLAALGGIALYFTSYWRPILYLAGALFVGTLTVFWSLRAPVTVSLEASRLILGATLVLLFTYLFYRDDLYKPDHADSVSDQNKGR